MFTPTEGRGSVVTRVVEKVTDVARSLFSPRVQKFLEAGYITKCNEFTPAYDNAMRLVALEKWGDELEAKADETIAAAAKASK